MTRAKLLTYLLGLAALPLGARAADPGVFQIPGTDSTIKFYGYVQLDTTFDFSGRDPNVEGNDWAVHVSNVPFDSSAEAKVKKNQLYMTARTSRFGLQTNTPTSWGPVGVKLEGDFNGTNLESGQTFTNSVLFRLRHAYGTVGNLLVGQTWSTFLDLNAAPDTVDFNGPGSLALIRNPMIRYTIPLAPGYSLALAVENAPGTDGNDYCAGDGTGPGDFSCGPSGSSKIQTIPDFHANLSGSGAWGTFSLRAVTSQTKRGSATDPNASTQSVQGIGAAASGSLKLGGDTLVGQIAYSSGVNRYIFYSGLSAPAVYSDGSSLKNVNSYGYHVGYTHVWSPAFRSNLVFSQNFIENPKVNGVEQFGNSVNKTISDAFVNTFWSFAKNAEFGLEYEWGQRKTFDVGTGSQKGTMNRVTGTFHYNFF